MTAPRVEKLRQFIQDLDALHRQFTDEATLLDAVAVRLASLVQKDDWLPKSTPCRIPTTISSICCMPIPANVFRLSASSGGRGNRRRFMTIGYGEPSVCCAARRRTSATDSTNAVCRSPLALLNGFLRQGRKSLIPRWRYSSGE